MKDKFENFVLYMVEQWELMVLFVVFLLGVIVGLTIFPSFGLVPV